MKERWAGLKAYLRLPREIWVLSGAVLINRMGNFVAPFLALYLTQKAGYTPEQTGLFIMALPLAVIPALLGGGWLADHWGRRRVLVTFQALAGTAYVAASFDPAGAAVPFWMIAATFFSSVSAIAHNAMLNDLAPSADRKTAFSLNYLGINIGFSLGPLLAGFLFNADLRLFFLLDGLSTWGSAALVYFLTRETRPTHEPAPAGEQPADGGLLRALGQRPFFVAFLAVGVLLNAVYNQHTFSLPLQLDKDFGAGGAAVFGTLMAVNALTVVAASTLLTQLTARFPSLVVIAAALGLYAVGFGMIGIIPGLPGPALVWLVVSTLIWTIGEILASVAEQVYLASHTPANHRGRFSSARRIVFNLGSALATGAAGLYIGGFGVDAIWTAVAAASVLAAAGLLLMHHIETRNVA